MTTSAFGFVDQEGNCIESTSIPTNAQEDVSSFLPRLYEAIEEKWNKLKDTIEVKGIGIGVPNGNYYKGTVEMPPNLNWGNIINLRQL
jgi:glucokinase